MSIGADTMLDEKHREFAIEHLNETETTRQNSLNDIQVWLNGEGARLHARTEPKYLLPFLRGCKFDIDKTKTKLTNYYTMRRDRPEWFTERNPTLPVMQALTRLSVFVPLKNFHDDKLVVIIRIAAHDPKEHCWNDLFKIGKMILDVACMEDQRAQIYGVIALFDMTGIGFSHYRTLTPQILKNAVYAWHNYHVRPKQLEFINAPTYVNVVLSLIKSFMSEKMRNRVKVHFGGVEKAQQIVDKSILPPEYGGEGDCLDSLGEYWHKKLLEYQEWFADDEVYKAE